MISLFNLDSYKKIFINKYFFITNLFLFFFYLTISFFTPYQGDDFIFKINPMEYKIDLKIINEALKQPWYWYNNWTGRFIGIFFLTLFLLPQKIYFDIINSIFQVLIINVIFYLSHEKIAKNIIGSSYLLLIHMLLFVGYYGYSSSVFSVTFSIVASWTHLFTFLYYIFFIKYWNEGYSFKHNILFFIFGIFIGCGFEHVFIGQIFLFFLLISLKLIKRSVILPHYIFHSGLGVLLGGVILMVAPGNYIRVNYSEKNFNFSFDKILSYWKFELEWFLFYIKPFWIIIFAISVIYFFIYKRRVKINIQALIILVCGFISSLSLSLSPSYHHGVNLFFYYCMLIFTISLFNFQEILLGKMKKVIFIFQIGFLLIFHSYLLFNQLQIHKYANKLEKEIIRKKAIGLKNITVKQINLKTNRFINYMALFDNPEDERNKGIARYYGIDKIKALK